MITLAILDTVHWASDVCRASGRKARGVVPLAVAWLLPALGWAQREIDFQRDIAPIFENRCTYCHGEDASEANLRLDLRASMLRGGDSGVPAVVPGHPEKSLLIEAIEHTNPDLQMPPDEERIPEEEIELIRQWIRQGAFWPGQMDTVELERTEHWSFRPVQRPPVPVISVPTLEKAANPIDAFLLHRLEEAELSFSPSADPRTLIRRASMVITGLPPTPDEVAAFLAEYEDDADAAYIRLVDRLLASPAFGERWAQHWLDVIRWAETNGSESNLYRKNAWIYRDYVVRSFNEDLPYDQFVQQQIAGDTLGVGEATGFLVAGPHVPAATVGREPAAIRQARADRMDEIMQTVGAAIMGVTIGCARCHNHKFDPLSIKDYYSMTAVFQDIEFGSRLPELAPDHPRRLRGEELMAAIEHERDALRRTGGWEENWGAYRELHFPPIETQAVRIRFKTTNVSIDELELFGPDPQSPNHAAARQGTRVSGYPEKGTEDRNPIENTNDGNFGTMAWRAKVEKGEELPWLRYDFSTPVSIARLRVSANREYFYETDYLQQKPHLPRYEFDLDIRKADGTWQPWTGTWVVNKKLNEEFPERKKHLQEIQRLIELLAEQGPQPSFIGRLIPPAKTFILLRGSPESPRDEVEPDAPEILSGELGLTADAPGPERRIAFARWLTAPTNPLTARVMANRIWHHVFGKGIVTTTSDFGSAGAAPTHPELLDWLAAELRDPQTRLPSTTESTSAPHAWSVKHLIRLMVLSHAFRQANVPHDKGMQVDDSTQLLWRYPPKRVEAEVIRDAILQASGCLDRTVGGRSYRIHNVKDTYAQWEVVDNWGPQTWRRMLYQERMRRVDDHMFTSFDFPDCGQIRDKRPVSTTPLQAFNLLNSPFVVDQAGRIAQRALSLAGGNVQGAIDHCFQLLLQRFPSEEEKRVCLETAETHGLSIVCRALMNSNEFVFLP
ncbi:MAG: cytochrome c [Pirellulaceae bacterium]|nr:MAG: cytochrome c [Pirellulaceae bacterium]